MAFLRLATPATDLARLARSLQRRSFQLFDLRELPRCHLLHQFQDRLLSYFANLDELHGGNSN